MTRMEDVCRTCGLHYPTWDCRNCGTDGQLHITGSALFLSCSTRRAAGLLVASDPDIASCVGCLRNEARRARAEEARLRAVIIEAYDLLADGNAVYATMHRLEKILREAVADENGTIARAALAGEP